MKSRNKKIYLLIGFLLVILIPFSNIANADCCMYPDELINPTISITGVSVTDGIVAVSVSFTAGACIWYDKDGNITTIYYGEIYQLSLCIYSSDGRKFGGVNVSIDHVYSGSDTLQWTSPSFRQDTYTIKVYAQDTVTISAPATGTVFVDNPLPRITSPADGSTVQGVGRYGVVDVTCEFFSTTGMRELCLEVWDGHYPYGTRVSTFGHMYSEPYPTSGTYTGQWQSAYRPQGAYNLILIATDSSFGWRWSVRTDPVTVTLVKGPPTASFTYSPENPLINDEIRFDASLSYDDGGIVKYEWDFGDENFCGSAEVQVVKHAYTQAGDYTVTLTVTDNDGMTGSVGSPVRVREEEQMVAPVNGCVFSGFGERMRNGKMKPHRGIDIVWAKPGDIRRAIVIAPARGVVDDVGDDPNTGYWIRLKHDRVRRLDGTVVENVYTFYCHLLELPSRDARLWNVGDKVKQGDVIGKVGETGKDCNGPHLHFGVREGKNIDDFVDPTKYVEYPGCKELRVEAHSPVDIRLMDPDGYIVSKTLIEIEMTATYLEDDFDGDGKTDDRIWLTDRKAGEYLITILPDPNARATDTYSLGITIDGQTMVLAEGVQIQDIPAEPYVFESKLNRSDFDNDGDVELTDLSTFCLHWLEQDCNYPNWCEGTDLNYDRFVDFTDFAIFAENWLWEIIPADFNIDGEVEFTDYAVLANQWRAGNCAESAWCDGADLNKSGSVDLFDLAEFAEHWLEGITP